MARGAPRRPDGVWVKIAKKGSGIASVAYPEVLDTAICFGWIDGRRNALDDRVLPAALHAAPGAQPLVEDQPREGRGAHRVRAHAPCGPAEVERAKADGRWEAAYAGQAQMAVPDDLQRELDARPGAAAFFAQLTSQNRYAILYRLHDAKRPETRARRLEKFVAMLEAGETIH